VLFGLVLRGRFDTDANAGARPRLLFDAPPDRARVFALRIVVAVGGVGLPLTRIFDGGPLLPIGVSACLRS